MTDPSTERLQALIDRMNAGDTAARDQLIEQVGARLQRVTRKIRRDFPRLRNHEETGDLLQKGLIRLLRALRSVKVGTVQEFFRLAALQVRRELLDLARRSARAGHVADAGSARRAETSDNTNDPLLLASWTEFHEKVETLPAQERDVVDLLWYQGLSQAEAAGVLQVSVPTIKRRWLSARLRLQAVLGRRE